MEGEETGGDGRKGDAERHRVASPPSCLHACSLNWKELVLHLLVSLSPLSGMVRSVKDTLPSASIRMIVLVLNGQRNTTNIKLKT